MNNPIRVVPRPHRLRTRYSSGRRKKPRRRLMHHYFFKENLKGNMELGKRITELSDQGEYNLENQETDDIGIEIIKNHWIETSCNDFKTMNDLFKSESYLWALFVGHIVVDQPDKGAA